MASLLTYAVKYKVPSAIAGKYDLKDVKVQVPYPFDVDPENAGEANFYMRRFFLEEHVKQKDPLNYYGFHEMKLDVVQELSDEDVEKYIESGDLVAIDPMDLTAEDINGFTKTKQFINVLMMSDIEHLKNEKGECEYNDVTDYVARNLSLYVGTDMQQKRSQLKKFLGINEAKETAKTSSQKRKGSFLEKAKKATNKRPARTKKEVSDDV